MALRERIEFRSITWQKNGVTYVAFRCLVKHDFALYRTVASGVIVVSRILQNQERFDRADQYLFRPGRKGRWNGICG